MLWLKFLIILCLNQVIKSDRNCNGKNFVGEHKLSNESLIEIPVNTPLTLKCQLDEVSIQNGCKSSNLAYIIGSNTIVKDDIQYNNNSLHFAVNTSKAMELTITCTYNDIGLNEVIFLNVGINPQPINLTCLNDQFKKMICKYDISRNHVKETITILMQNQLIPTNYSHNSRKIIFEIKKSFNPFDLIEFQVSVSNSIGPTLHQNITFETDKIVKLSGELSIELNNLTSNKVTAIWKLPIVYKMYEFIHIQYLNGNRLKDLNPVKTSNTINHIVFESDISLPYAYTNYALTITTYVKNAINWMKQHGRSTIKFQSKSRIPDSPPQIIPGAFEYNANNNDVVIYWKETVKKMKNGEDFCIKLQEVRSNGLLINDINVTLSDTWAKLHNLNPENVYDIKLIAENSEGRSKTFSTIIIPKIENLLPSPQHLKVLTNESLYHLSWISQGPTDNFTIFACQPHDEQNSMCQILIYYKTIPGIQTSFIFNNTLLKHPKIFAISSNLNGRSSGMQWFTCVSSTKTEMATIDNATILPINVTTIKLNWTLSCKISPFLTGINISYYELELYKSKICRTYFHPTNLSPEVFIDRLTPYTNYMLELSMFDGNKTGPMRQMQFRTNFGMPETPTEIKYSKVTNNTVEIYWTAPTNWNGLPRYYNISYVNEFKSHFSRINIPSDFTILENLRSSTRYRIQVAACHSICSAFSDEVVVKTKMGIPEKITNFKLDNAPIYEWSPPNITNGDFQVYEIKFDVSINGKIETRNGLMSQTKCTLSKYFCSYSASIRTINLNEQIKIDTFTKKQSVNCLEEININYTELCSIYECVPGRWEIVTDRKCVQSYLIILIAFYLFTVLILFGVIFTAIQKCYKRFKMITDFHASIPTGLELLFEPYRVKNVDIVSRHLSFDDVSQTITCEELQKELELRDIQDYELQNCHPVSCNENYVQIGKQNIGYVRISNLT